MTSRRFITLAEVWKILEECAPGYQKRRTRDHIEVVFKGHRPFNLSCGAHGAPDRAEIRCSNVRKMSRYLQIDDCVLPLL